MCNVQIDDNKSYVYAIIILININSNKFDIFLLS